MRSYFIDNDGVVIGECLTDKPANPDNHTIIASESALETGGKFIGGVYVPVAEVDSPIYMRVRALKTALAELDQRRIRPLAEGDADYLATLNAQAVALRAELQDLK